MKKIILIIAGALLALGVCLPVQASVPQQRESDKPQATGTWHRITPWMNLRDPQVEQPPASPGQELVNTWYYTAHDGPPVGTNSGYCWNDTNNGGDGTHIQLYQCGASNEGFALYTYSGDPGWLEIRYYPGTMCVDDTNGGGNGTPLQIWNCKDDYDQMWKYHSFANNDTYPVAWFNQYSGACIDDEYDFNGNYGYIQLYNCLGTTPNQAWLGP